MGCTVCKSQGCEDGKDCYGIKDRCQEIYSSEGNRLIVETATLLRKSGREKSISRMDEIISYCKSLDYERIGVAYCHALPAEAKNIEEALIENELYPVMLKCTTGGLTENDLTFDSGEDLISCNPAGQAILLEQLGVDFVLEVGLCLGHDVLFHDNLHVPFTTLIVKDRLYANNPAAAFPDYRDRSTNFLESLKDTNHSVTIHTLAETVGKNKNHGDLLILDLRQEKAYHKEHIPDSINIPLEKLPELMRNPVIDLNDLDKKVVCYCSDGSTAPFAVMYLYQQGFRDVSNLKGGFKRWKKEGYEILSQGEMAV
jgi:uncharacterized metal-binding protein/rhodanese-related sulfurtransferase